MSPGTNLAGALIVSHCDMPLQTKWSAQHHGVPQNRVSTHICPPPNVVMTLQMQQAAVSRQPSNGLGVTSAMMWWHLWTPPWTEPWSSSAL